MGHQRKEALASRGSMLGLVTLLLASVTLLHCGRKDDGEKAYLPVGTMVATAEGEVAVEDLRRGMLVKSFDQRSGEVVLAPIEEIHLGDTTRLRSLELENGHTVRLRQNRPVFRVNRTVPEWIESDDVGQGDEVLSLSGEEEATAGLVRRVVDVALAYPVATYGIEVGGGPNVHGVFANGILVQ